MMARAPFSAPAVEVYKTQQRAMGLMYGESGGLAMVSDYDRERRWVEVHRIFLDDPGREAAEGVEPEHAGPLQEPGCSG